MLILEFAIDRDEKKDKQARSMSDGEKRGSYCACALTSMVNWWEEDCSACDNKKINCHYILLEHPVSFLRCCASLLLEAQWQKRSFSCIRQIHDWLYADRSRSIRRFRNCSYPCSHNCYFKNRYTQYLYDHPP